jgi:hypothetical protein
MIFGQNSSTDYEAVRIGDVTHNWFLRGNKMQLTKESTRDFIFMQKTNSRGFDFKNNIYRESFSKDMPEQAINIDDTNLRSGKSSRYGLDVNGVDEYFLYDKDELNLSQVGTSGLIACAWCSNGTLAGPQSNRVFQTSKSEEDAVNKDGFYISVQNNQKMRVRTAQVFAENSSLTPIGSYFHSIWQIDSVNATCTFYLNGAFDGTDNIPTGTNYTDGTLGVLATSVGNVNYTGQVDDLRLYKGNDWTGTMSNMVWSLGV